MLTIECKRRRKGGSRVTLGTKTYFFLQRADGRHVADVEDPLHAKALLKIDAYEIAPEEGEENPDTLQDAQEQMAGNTGTDSDNGDPDPDEIPVKIEDMEHDELIDEHARVFGSAPHPAAKPETLRKKLIAKRDGADEQSAE